ncbi:hypothetical protein [Amycolatopsis thermoflava]|uniref:hypothetical protein n=1 Tax=Amycolatopsis thermoflava TaxID=84480 RepID=UPI003F49E861
MITTCTRTLAAGGWQATTTLAPPPGDLETPPLAAARPKINPSRTATHHRPDVLQDATTRRDDHHLHPDTRHRRLADEHDTGDRRPMT